ncbi:MAG: glutamate--tRNA ligase, partial [Myxococcaceae bacterium]|nr:glutamate--tRNA ligase [Myxococcaceae bacterium]
MSDARARTPSEENAPNFIRELVEADLAANKFQGRVHTRFPPEPNGYLHIGHCKAIATNFGAAALSASGLCNLRFDDTNPVKEDVEYVESIKRDIRWMGFDWQDREYYASDYFERMYACAVDLIERGLAYVDSQSLEDIRKNRGDFYTQGTDSPYRERSVAENLRLFAGMRAGEFQDGEHVLRGKIDMKSPDVLLRDPLFYRIKHAHHHRTGDTWCIYPMYDMAHPPSDSIEEVTHSLCTMEFIPHRELYDWLLKNIETFPSHQYEFARRNLSYTVMSKRKLLQLVQ